MLVWLMSATTAFNTTYSKLNYFGCLFVELWISHCQPDPNLPKACWTFDVRWCFSSLMTEDIWKWREIYILGNSEKKKSHSVMKAGKDSETTSQLNHLLLGSQCVHFKPVSPAAMRCLLICKRHKGRCAATSVEHMQLHRSGKLHHPALLSSTVVVR